VADGGFNLGNIAGHIAGALREGQSVTRALNEYRAAGGSVRTQTWYRIAGQVRAALGRAQEWATMDYGQAPRSDQFSPWDARARGGEYLYHFDVYVGRQVELEGGQREKFTFTTQISAAYDHPVAPEVAADAALSDAELGAEGYGDDVQGVTLRGLYRMMGVQT
jgi:hypothetical protein